MSHEKPSVIPWPPLLFAGAVAAGLILGELSPLPWPGLDDRPARIAGYALGLVGVALAGWGIFTLMRAGTTVQPHKTAGRLVTEGAFRFRRNPIYMGEVLVFLGLAQVTYNIWLAIMAPVFAVAILFLSILPEERHLEARFGDEYRDYKARTRRWF
ncbi:MAG TPA: isoprenylcysteine carboxylmethyltransferase family protein [Hyphomicrobiaceae bacterium]|jgi:protein-S-isoprenylcysteine O-methyltransferase Ste14|nr:isoprenylcysteine carboxylmethyltransferase family protein [Hyphomicrobiaceae bacterium]